MRNKTANSVGSGQMVNGPICLLKEFGFNSAGNRSFFINHIGMMLQCEWTSFLTIGTGVIFVFVFPVPDT